MRLWDDFAAAQSRPAHTLRKAQSTPNKPPKGSAGMIALFLL
jgi:hypothetical protein